MKDRAKCSVCGEPSAHRRVEGAFTCLRCKTKLDGKCGSVRFNRSHPKRWTMPEWMEPYRHLFINTGGNSIEDLMNREPALVQINAPLALIQVAVESQVFLLNRMYLEGLITTPVEIKIKEVK